jgi:outer membrane protein
MMWRAAAATTAFSVSLALSLPGGPGPAAAVAATLTLEGAIGRALERNERPRAAEEDVKAATALVRRARSFLLPDITVTGEYRLQGAKTETPFLEGSDRRTLSARLDQTLFDARAWPLLRQASRGRDAARWTSLDVRRRLAFETAESFLAALTAERVARAAEERLALARRNREEVRLRFEGELAGSNDVTRAELEAANAERESVRAIGAARTARLALGNLLQAEVVDTLAPPAALLERAGRAVDSGSLDLQAAGSRRPDVNAERARVASLRASAWEPLFRYIPRVSAFGTTRSIEGTRPTDGGGDWTLGLAGTWDLFDGGDREADRAARAAAARSASLSLQNLERSVALDVETARVTLESEQASLARAAVAVEAARRNTVETAELYRRGLARALEVTDANVQLFEAEVERSGAQFALALAYLNLRAALGWEPLEGPNDDTPRGDPPSPSPPENPR